MSDFSLHVQGLALDRFLQIKTQVQLMICCACTWLNIPASPGVQVPTLGDAPVGTDVVEHAPPPVSTFTPTPLLGTAPPHTCVPPSSFPSVVSWTQYHTLQFTDKKVRLPELFCWQKSLTWKPWWAHAFPGYALSLIFAHEPLPHSLRLTNFYFTLDTRGISLTLGSAHRTGHLLGGQYC